MRAAASEPEIQREVGARIQRARQAAGLTQEAAADDAGIDYKRWQRLEAGRANPTIRTLLRVAAALDVTIWCLLAPPPSVRSRSARGAPRADAALPNVAANPTPRRETTVSEVVSRRPRRQKPRTSRR